jgi:peptide/nickel transport system substrate-binding protein
MQGLLRRVAALILLAGIASVMGSCRDKQEGAVRVLVIGDASPRLKDPSAAPLDPGDELLLSNVAQGLVRFDAAGNIVGGLAERWNVSNDGLSYIFRLAATEWPDGRKITGEQVARSLKRQLSSRSRNPLKDALGAVEDVVAMTDRVIEIRLVAPRPNLLPLLAQPEFAIFRDGQGTGPFAVSARSDLVGDLKLSRDIVSAGDDELRRHEEVRIGTAEGQAAIRAFAASKADIVLGGTFAELPWIWPVKLPRNSLRFDPASGLFGLVPTKIDGRFSDVEARRLLSEAIDRDALVATLRVPGLTPRASVLEPGLDGLPSAFQPPWLATPLADRREGLIADANRLFGSADKPAIRIELPEGPGAEILLARLAADWGALGFTVERAKSPASADFRLIDEVAPSTSPAWFLRSFRCGNAPVCEPETDELLRSAREAAIPAQRYALLLEASRRIDDAQLFIALTAPVRWSLVNNRILGFSGNRYARHTLTDLEVKLGAGAQ